MGVTERYVGVLPDMDRDDTVTTQTTTQNAPAHLPPIRATSGVKWTGGVHEAGTTAAQNFLFGKFLAWGRYV
jgi:hypothetical protein